MTDNSLIRTQIERTAKGVHSSRARISWCCSEASSEESDCGARASLDIADGGADDLIASRQAGHGFANAIFPQCPHTHFSGARAQNGGWDFLINELSGFIINHKDFED